jgi:hypothetical protein
VSIAGRIRCLFGKHERSQALARDQGKSRVSRCKHCGIGMRQGERRKWYVDRSVRMN